MILSEQTRRWTEIQFYYFCLDLYHIRNNMIDVILLIEVVCQIAELNYPMLKSIAGKMMGDPIYLPHRDEVVSLAHAMGNGYKNIAKITDLSINTIRTILNTNRNKITTPYPMFEIPEDQEMYKFIQQFSEIKKVGI